MADSILRLGIVGCGGATQIMYVPILRHVERLQVTALCDPHRPSAEGVQALLRTDLEIYTDYDEFLRRAPVDAVIIATPVFLHHEQVLKAAAAGKHILCEKPMAPTLPECDAMLEACRAAGVVLTIGFMKRFDHSLQHAKALLDEGRLGAIDQLLCEWRGGMPSLRRPELNAARPPGPSWRPRLQTLGGAYQDLGSHTTHLCRWWLGEVESVSADFSMIGESQEVDNSATVLYRHAGGVRSLHLLGAMQKPPTELYQLDGTRATLAVHFGPGASFTSADPFSMTLYEEGGRRVSDETQYAHTVIDVELARHGRYKRELDHFRDAVLDGAPLLVSGEDGRRVMEIINAGYLSAYLGQTVRLPLTEPPDLARIFTEMRERVSRR